MNSRITLLEIYLYTGVDKQIWGFFPGVFRCKEMGNLIRTYRCWFNYSVLHALFLLSLTRAELFSLLRQVIEN